jgi:hypothetical protein
MPSDGLPEFKPSIPLQSSPEPIRRLPVPQTVEAAFWLTIASCALSLIMFFVGLAGGALNGGAQSSSYLIGSLIGIGLRGLFAFAVRRGAGYARILLSLIAAISLLGLGASFNAVSLVLVAMVVVAVVLLWLPSSNTYFRAVVSEKAAAKARNLPR